MQEDKIETQEDKAEKPEDSAEETRHPVPGIKHVPEPDAENIMPAEDRPGTL